jgi:hypothetical protein
VTGVGLDDSCRRDGVVDGDVRYLLSLPRPASPLLLLLREDWCAGFLIVVSVLADVAAEGVCK